MKSEEVIFLVWSLVFNSLISLSRWVLSSLSRSISLSRVMHQVFQFLIETESITFSANDSLSSLMNDSALKSFNESVSEIWEKRLRNSLKHSSINKCFDMMKFEERTRSSEWRCSTVLMKMYDQVFNLQKRMLLIRRVFLICEFLSDSQAIHEDSLSSILLIELNSLFSLVCFTRMNWFSWSSKLCILSEW